MSTPGATRKRKEIGPFDPHRPPLQSGTVSASIRELACNSNRLLAGYMAYEFLTRGTLLGEKFDPTKAETLPSATGDRKRLKPETEPGGRNKVHQCYADVAGIVMSQGTHVPGVVNPTQLAQWIRM